MRSYRTAPPGARPLVAVAAFALLAAPDRAAPQVEASPVAIEGVTIVDVTSGSLLANRTVLVRDGRISRISSEAAPQDVEVIDGAGRYLIPGLWDVHVHLRFPQAASLVMPQFVAHGVTGVRDMASDCDGGEGEFCVEEMKALQAAVEAGEQLGPRLLALSSAPLNPPWDYQVTEEEARSLVGVLDERGVDWIKTYYRLSPEAFEWIADEAKKRGLAVGGHIPLRMTAAAASDAGLESLEHARDFLFDCFPGSAEFRASATSQNPTMDVMRSMVDDHDPEVCQREFRTLIRNETWYVPTHVTRRMDAFADDSTFRDDSRAKYIPAEAWAAWQEDADGMVALDPSPEGRRIMRSFYEKGLEITGRAHAAGVRIALGTDAGDTYVFPGSSVHDELQELVKAGLTPADALAAATIRGAEFLGLEGDYGTVEVGKRGDLVVLEGNPLANIENTRRIAAVILGGQVLDRSDLDDLLDDVANKIAGGGP